VRNATLILLAGLIGQPVVVGAFRQNQSPIFRSAVDLVSVSAIVRDRKGRFVRDLQRTDFEVLDTGRPARIVQFQSAETGPVSIAMLFDVSGSMQVAWKLDGARQVANQIIATLEPSLGDEAALYSFDSRLRELQPFTQDPSKLRGALTDLLPFGATSLYDAIGETSKRVVARDARRRAVVVLTDGVDTYSRRTPSEVSGAASSIDVPVFIVAALSPFDHPADSAAGPPDNEELQSLARWTGGELYFASAPAHANIAARSIIAALRHQYLIAFEASGQPGWHPVEIRLRDRDLKVRARGGYTASGRPTVE
jgi:Ca-activated chloride channel family protein